MNKIRTRDANLDLLRAIAIVAVLVYHLAIMWPVHDATIHSFASLGKYGVTLFFVLSGWLIGGIYWREHRAAGRVKLGNFWMRRWLRTVPPYLLGMSLAYADLFYGRGDPFDYRYLLFLQNYEPSMPFYMISWSLCVEEHFYLLLPLIGILCAKLPVRWAAAAVWSLPAVSPLLRVLDPNVDLQASFGYSHTATHLVSEGLALGVAAAFTRHYFPEQWAAMQKWASYLAAPGLVAFLSLPWWDEAAEFYVGQSLVAGCALVWLAACVEREPLPLAANRLTYAIAVASYSLYLTHTLAILIASRFAVPTGSSPGDPLALICRLAMIALAGSAFYLFVERPAIQFRDYVSQWLKSRRDAQGPEPAVTNA
ncbi:MAG: acyltransferase family protein [Aureliella sp.]